MNSIVDMAPEKDEIWKQFGDGLKDLKNLRKQLHSAADYFEASYNKHINQKQFIFESSREYVTKALVSTVDHLGSAAHKLNKFLDENTTQFSATNLQLSLIQQRLRTVQELTPVSHNMLKIEATSHNKHTLLPVEEFGSDELKVLNSKCVLPETVLSCKSVNKAARMDPSFIRKEDTRKAPSPNPPSFSFTKMAPDKGAGRRSVSPLRFLSDSVIKRSISPTPSLNKGRWASEPRRAVSAGRRRHDLITTTITTMNTESEKEMELESYTKRSKNLFKALVSLHHSKKDTTVKSLPKPGNLAYTSFVAR